MVEKTTLSADGKDDGGVDDSTTINSCGSSYTVLITT